MLKQYVQHYRYFAVATKFVHTSTAFGCTLALKRFFMAFLVCMAVVFLSVPVNAQDPFVLVIDAGHGGHDSGTRGKYSMEKDVALAIALRFGQYVKDSLPGVKVIYTRDKDVFVKLDERAAIANHNNANLFVSIHVDGVTNTRVTGNSTFVMGLHRSEENLKVAERENAVIMKEENYAERYGDFDPTSPESYIKLALQQNLYLDLSLQIASYVQDNFSSIVKRKNRGVRQAGFLVLYKTTMPSVLIETGFLTNPDEENYLNSKKGQDEVAYSIYRAFRAYKAEIDWKTISEKEIEKIIQQHENEDLNSGVVFRVQLLSSRKAIAPGSKQFKGIDEVYELKDGNLFKYYSRAERDYDKIVNLQYEIRKKFSDAFVVAFKDGERISVKQALKEIKKKG